MTTSQLSMELDCEEESPYSRAARPVNPLALQAAVEGLVTSVGSGVSTSALCARSHPDGSWRRTLQDSLPMLEAELSQEWSMDWPKWATVWGGECGELSTSGLATSEPEYSSSDDVLPTVTSDTAMRQNRCAQGGLPLSTALLGTPTARDHKGRGRPGQLPTQMLPTPNAFDSKGMWNRSDETAHREKGGCRYLSEVLATPAAADAHGSHGGGQGKSLRTDMHRYKAESGASGALNPSFVEVMMGFPPGWTTPTESKPSGTP